MSKILIYVEGQTEETFVRDVLAPHLAHYGVYVTPIVTKTKQTKDGTTFRGGITSYAQTRGEIRKLLGDSSAALVTTMIDYYGLPRDFPGMDLPVKGVSAAERVAMLEKALAEDIAHKKFAPFLVLHEFEALRLTQPRAFERVFPEHEGAVHKLVQEIAGLAPEAINDGRETHPAARIGHLFPGYRKRLHGPLIANHIGLEAIRDRCPHFAEWLKRLEAFGKPPNSPTDTNAN